MSSFPIRIDGDCLCEPDTRSIESIAPKLRISRLVTFLELHITGVQRGFVKMRVELERLLILCQCLVQFTAHKRSFALANRSFGSFDI